MGGGKPLIALVVICWGLDSACPFHCFFVVKKHRIRLLQDRQKLVGLPTVFPDAGTHCDWMVRSSSKRPDDMRNGGADSELDDEQLSYFLNNDVMERILIEETEDGEEPCKDVRKMLEDQVLADFDVIADNRKEKKKEEKTTRGQRQESAKPKANSGDIKDLLYYDTGVLSEEDNLYYNGQSELRQDILEQLAKFDLQGVKMGLNEGVSTTVDEKKKEGGKKTRAQGQESAKSTAAKDKKKDLLYYDNGILDEEDELYYNGPAQLRQDILEDLAKLDLGVEIGPTKGVSTKVDGLLIDQLNRQMEKSHQEIVEKFTSRSFLPADLEEALGFEGPCDSEKEEAFEARKSETLKTLEEKARQNKERAAAAAAQLAAEADAFLAGEDLFLPSPPPPPGGEGGARGRGGRGEEEGEEVEGGARRRRGRRPRPAPAPALGLAPADAAAAVLGALRQMDQPYEYHGAAVALQFTTPLEQYEMLTPPEEGWRRLIQQSPNAAIFSTRLLAGSKFRIFTDFDSCHVAELPSFGAEERSPPRRRPGPSPAAAAAAAAGGAEEEGGAAARQPPPPPPTVAGRPLYPTEVSAPAPYLAAYRRTVRVRLRRDGPEPGGEEGGPTARPRGSRGGAAAAAAAGGRRRGGRGRGGGGAPPPAAGGGGGDGGGEAKGREVFADFHFVKTGGVWKIFTIDILKDSFYEVPSFAPVMEAGLRPNKAVVDSSRKSSRSSGVKSAKGNEGEQADETRPSSASDDSSAIPAASKRKISGRRRNPPPSQSQRRRRSSP